MLRIIQLFIDSAFNKRLQMACNKYGYEVLMQEVDASVVLNAASGINKQTIFMVNKDVVDLYSDQLHDLSLLNLIIYVYQDDKEIIGNSNVDGIADNYLNFNFKDPDWYTVLKVSSRMMDSWYSQHTLSFLFGKLERFSSETLPSLYNSLSEAIYWKNSDGVYVGCNQRFANDFGFEHTDDVVGKRDVDIMDEKSAISFSTYDKQVLDLGKNAIDIEKEIQLHLSKEWLSFSKFPISDFSGNVRGILGKYSWISKNKKLEQKYETQQNLLHALMDNIPDSIYFKDTNSKFIAVNDPEAVLLNINDPQKAIGKTDFDFFDSGFAQKAYADEQKLIFEGTGIIERQESINVGNEKIYYDSIKAPFKDKEGQIAGIVGVSRNVTERVRIAKELNVEKHLLNLLMKHLPSSIYFKDRNSKYTRVNKAHADFLGLSNTNDAIGKTDHDFKSCKEADSTLKDEVELFSTGKPIIGKTESCTKGSSETEWFSTTKVPMRDKDGIIVGLVGISYNITNEVNSRIKIEDALKKEEEANKAKSIFLSHVSHEIRTPLNGVIGIGEILAKSKLNNEQREMIDVILNSGNTLLYLVNDILDLSKIEAGKLQLELQPLVINELVKEVIQMLNINAQEKNLKLFVEFGKDIPLVVYGDSLRLKQILINLVNNAIKFTHNGEVRIRTSLKELTTDEVVVEFRVADTGIGIPEYKQQSIFNSFTQIDSSTTRKYGGVGLGLAISRSLVEKMDGVIELSSEVGKGSEFYFTAHFKRLKND